MVGVQTDSQDLGEAVDGAFTGSVESYVREAFDYFRKEEYEKAESALQKAISLDPNNLSIRRRLLECYIKQEDHVSALACLKGIDRKRYCLFFDPDFVPDIEAMRREIDADYRLGEELSGKVEQKVKVIADIIAEVQLQG